MQSTSKLTLGPILYNWSPEKKRDFYFKIADEAPVDVVYVGEVTCSKRTPFFDPVIPEICERLEAAGKEVVLSTLALVMSKREQTELKQLATPDLPYAVEANDLSAISLLQGAPHIVGPFVNVYNEGTLNYLYANGATRIVLPNELSSTSMFELGRAAKGAELEAQVFGRLPLALSARCYHARHQNLSKDGCQYVCEKDPDGMTVETLDGDPFLAINGTQTMSYTVQNLLGELNELKAHGITHFRLWPQDVDMIAVAQHFRRILNGESGIEQSFSALEEIVPFAPHSNGFFHARPGIDLVE
ncbi:MAG: U32 family peptidase [Sneathiella sp.]